MEYVVIWTTKNILVKKKNYKCFCNNHEKHEIKRYQSSSL